MYRESEDGKQEILFFTRRHSVLEPRTTDKRQRFRIHREKERERECILFIYPRMYHIETFDENIEICIHTSYNL